MPVNRMCKDCGKSIIVWSTAQTRCPKCQQARSKAKPPKPLKRSTKPIAKVGKQGKKTASAVEKWKRAQKPNDQGYCECYICHKWVTYLRAEHMLSKARHPSERTNPDNFAPVCDECNDEKRSKDYVDGEIK